MAKWRKQSAISQRGISLARGAPMPKPSGKGATPLLPDAVRAFLAALERTHAQIAAWLPTFEDTDASPAERTQASLAIMIAANSLTDDIKELAEATQVDAEHVGDARRAKAFDTIKRTIRQHV